MSEVALTADHIIVIGKGRIIANAPVKDIVDGGAQHTVRVRTPQATQLAELLTRDGATVTSDEPSLLQITGVEAPGIGELAAASGIVLHELTPVTSTLEEAYMLLTADSVEYQTESATQHVGHGVDSPADAPISEGAKR
ncbi:hypothetical protein D3C74_390140 [compost metagenome]